MDFSRALASEKIGRASMDTQCTPVTTKIPCQLRRDGTGRSIRSSRREPGHQCQWTTVASTLFYVLEFEFGSDDRRSHWHVMYDPPRNPPVTLDGLTVSPHPLCVQGAESVHNLFRTFRSPTIVPSSHHVVIYFQIPPPPVLTSS